MKNDGGPAFPYGYNGIDGEPYTSKGMTLRDYFAIHASEKDIEKFSEFEYIEPKVRSHPGHKITQTRREEARYAFADAMLKERDK